MTFDSDEFISEEEFSAVWGAHAKPNGDLYFHDEVVPIPVENVWTISENEALGESGFNLDNNWYASPGLHYVNALGYVITDRPWNDETKDAIWIQDDDDRAREERRTDFVEYG